MWPFDDKKKKEKKKGGLKKVEVKKTDTSMDESNDYSVEARKKQIKNVRQRDKDIMKELFPDEK